MILNCRLEDEKVYVLEDLYTSLPYQQVWIEDVAVWPFLQQPGLLGNLEVDGTKEIQILRPEHNSHACGRGVLHYSGRLQSSLVNW